MRINGEWLFCDDGVERPVIRGEILSGDGFWHAVEFLVDIGADRTMLSANVFEALGLPALKSNEQIAGVGGIVESLVIATKIRLACDDATSAVFRGEFAACLDYESLDMSVLGRDIMNAFAAIIDHDGDCICLLRGHHSYDITLKS